MSKGKGLSPEERARIREKYRQMALERPIPDELRLRIAQIITASQPL